MQGMQNLETIVREEYVSALKLLYWQLTKTADGPSCQVGGKPKQK
jgi:hypothetical protein